MTTTSPAQTPEGTRYTLRVEGMTCASCSSRVERNLRRLPGVRDVAVNLATHLASVVTDPTLTEKDLEACVVKSGYGAEAVRHEDALASAAKPPDTSMARRRLVLAVTLAVPLMILGMMHLHAWWSLFCQAVLAFVVSYVAGYPIHASALARLRHGDTTMDTLVSLGSTAAYAYSLFAWIRGDHGHIYFETAGGIVAFILLGRYLEALSKSNASSGLASLYAMRSTEATMLRGDAQVVVPVEVVRVNDVVKVRPAQRFPLDGFVVEGTSSVDESMLSGEPMPVTKTVGDAVHGGSLNGEGALLVRVCAPASESALARIGRLVADAQGSRAPLQRLADRVSAWFVPGILILSFATFVGWITIANAPMTAALMTGVSVLVIACPCALGLAAPTAIMVGIARAAKAQVLIRDAASLEHAASIDVIVFDKTGTLTEGKPSVIGVMPAPGASEDDVIGLGASLGQSSEHPLGKALVIEAKRRNLAILSARDVRAIPGIGMSGTVEDAELRIVSVDAPVSFADDWIKGARAQGQTVSMIVRQGQPAGVVAYSDRVRVDAADCITRLHALGVRTVLATGDHELSASIVASSVGIGPSDVHARQSPESKMALVRAIQQQGHVVGMAGDGVNDAPALAAANVGVAMGSGTDVANEAASITIARSDIAALVEAIEISKATVGTIRQNLAWAFGYNLIAVPLAMFGLLTKLGGPMIAAAAMAMSSVSVVLNSIRLGRSPWQHRETRRQGLMQHKTVGPTRARQGVGASET